MELSVCAFLKKNKLNKVVLSEERPRYTLLVPLLYNNGQHMMRDKKYMHKKFSHTYVQSYASTIYVFRVSIISSESERQEK